MCLKNKTSRFLAVLLAVLLMFTGVFNGTCLTVKVSAASYSTDYPNTWVNTGNQVEDLIGVAMSQVGYWGTEYGTGTKYGAWYGNTYAPWCGMFISWCANQAGIPTSIIIKSARANDFRKSGTYHYKDNYIPQRGDILLYNPNDGNGYFFPSKNSDGTYSRNQHVALVCSYDAATGKIWIVHGNATGDKVCYNAIYMSNPAVQSFVTPPYTSGGAGPNAGVVVPDCDYINGDSVRVRSAASTSSEILAQVNTGTKVEVLGSVTDADGDKWYNVKIKDTGVVGYVFGEYVTIVKTNTETSEPKSTVNGDDVRVRDAASTNGTNIITTVNKGQVVNILETVTDAEGDKWYKVSFVKDSNEYTGFIFGEFINVAEKPQPDPLANVNHIASSGTRLRASASTNSEIITTLSQGQVVNIINVDYDANGDGWYYLSLTQNGTSYTGYVFHNLVNVKVPLSPSFSAALDTPSNDTSIDVANDSVLSVSGWAFTNLGNAGCFYKIDGSAPVKMNTVERQDVKNVYGSACPNLEVGFKADIDVSQLSAGKHTLQILLTGGTTAKVYTERSFTVSDSIVPVANDCIVSSISADGYNVDLEVTDNKGISSVRYAVWTYTDDQDDLKWFDAENKGNNRYGFRVNTKDYTSANDGYYTHIYATDTYGNVVCVKALFFNPATYAPAVVSFDANGGTDAPESITDDYLNGDVLLPQQTPKRAGFVFMGWSSTSTDNTAHYFAGQRYLFETDTVLYAVWNSRESFEVGDINGDNKVNTTDLAILKVYISGKYVSDAINCDVDGNGIINVVDLAYLKKIIAGLI